MNDLEIVSIYALLNPLNNKIFYVGCSHNPQARLYQHLNFTGEDYKSKVISEIKSHGKYVGLLILEECNIKDAADKENLYIKHFISSGHTLRQNFKSKYPSSLKRKLNNFRKIEFSEEINQLAIKLSLPRDFLVRIAIKEFIDKNNYENKESTANYLKSKYSSLL